MKKLLLATAAAAALLFAPVLASAQYATQPTAPITTPAPAASTTSDNALDAQPSTSGTAPAAPTTVTGQTSAPTMPRTTAQNSAYGAQTAPSSTYTESGAAPATQMNAQAATPSGYGAPAQADAPSTYGATQTAAANGQVRGQLISDTKALELAQDAGMQAVPMSAGAVCQPRAVDLSGGATHDNRNALEFAVDRASVCELQEIQLPARGAASFRQALIRRGVDESKIGDSGANEARMTFAGVATSSAQYAAMFNPVRTAANTTSAAPSYAPAPSAAPSSSYAPAPSTAPAMPDHSSMDHSSSDQPSDTAPAQPPL